MPNEKRERLIELIRNAPRNTRAFNDQYADYLLKNDVRPVPCRCENCKNSKPNDEETKFCMLWRDTTLYDGYCSYGMPRKRSENGKRRKANEF